MADEANTRKPGRSVFYDDPEATDHPVQEDDRIRAQLRSMIRAMNAVRKGDLSIRMPTEEGIMGEVFDAFNDLIGLNEEMSNEIVRVASVVGEEGRLSERISMGGVSGGWKTTLDSIDSLINNLGQPTTDVARVITAVAEGDLSKKMALELEGRQLRGEFLRMGTTVNGMVDQLNTFSSEVTRVAREVGVEGRLGAQAEVPGASGIWRELADNVNSMAGNLTSQVRNIAQVTTAVANGDLSQKITVEAAGEIAQLKDTINAMVDSLNLFAGEVTRVSKEVGGEGKLGAQAEVPGVAGTWKELTGSVNMLAENLTSQVRNIAQVTTAVANGDLSQKITVEASGEISDLKDTVNRMVDSLNIFASEVTRVASEVGGEGKLGAQAEVPGVAGTWKDLTDNVNMLAENLTNQVRNIAQVTSAVAQGDLSQKITVEAAGEISDLKDTVNRMVDSLNIFASEVTRVASEVGGEGKLGAQAEVPGVAGTWKDLTDNVNMLAENLTSQVRNIAQVTSAVAQGDLSQKITVEAAGEILELKDTVNGMVDQLNAFASEVTRVSKEVGTEGRLGAQADVPGAAGTWRVLTDNVNVMAANLTNQVRNIAAVTAAVANGDLSQKITVEAQGEILELKETINGMVDNLSAIIGDINNVMTTVGEGDLTRLVSAEAAGEFSSMVSGINGTIDSLRGIVTELTEAGINIGSVSQSILSAGQETNAMVTQLSSSVSQIADGAKAQAQMVAGASSESEGVGETASNTLTRSEGMNQMAEAATKAVAEGSSAMDETIHTTELMLQGSNESVTSIESLSKSSEQIQEIVDVIRDIATQTNILAINAAIEAVRAGKQGKGFAVVAEEVKTLSADSKSQAKSISALVQSVQKETQNTVSTIKTMADNVKLGKKAIEQTSKSFGDINRSIESTSVTGKEISVAAGEQKKSIDAVSQSLDKISGIAADTSTVSIQSSEASRNLMAKMQELTGTATGLAAMSDKLQQTVGRFVLAEGAQAKPAATQMGK